MDREAPRDFLGALGPKVRTERRFASSQKLPLSASSDEFEIAVQTQEGNITLNLDD